MCGWSLQLRLGDQEDPGHGEWSPLCSSAPCFSTPFTSGSQLPMLVAIGVNREVYPNTRITSIIYLDSSNGHGKVWCVISDTQIYIDPQTRAPPGETWPGPASALARVWRPGTLWGPCTAATRPPPGSWWWGEWTWVIIIIQRGSEDDSIAQAQCAALGRHPRRGWPLLLLWWRPGLWQRSACLEVVTLSLVLQKVPSEGR